MQQAAMLTIIGIITAFGLLVLLMAVISIVGRLSTHVLDRAEREAAERIAKADAEAHDKALAALAAVTALLASAGRTEGRDA
jgi:Na+-transporting methylmalonyl-CoA/oxaloacetate decarboxylase gamma subunit